MSSRRPPRTRWINDGTALELVVTWNLSGDQPVEQLLKRCQAWADEVLGIDGHQPVHVQATSRALRRPLVRRWARS